MDFTADRAHRSAAGAGSGRVIASPAVVEQKAVVEQTDLPKAVPTETDDPDRLVTPSDVKKPNDDDPKINHRPGDPVGGIGRIGSDDGAQH